jgi:hypothetical protein
MGGGIVVDVVVVVAGDVEVLVVAGLVDMVDETLALSASGPEGEHPIRRTTMRISSNDLDTSFSTRIRLRRFHHRASEMARAPWYVGRRWT